MHSSDDGQAAKLGSSGGKRLFRYFKRTAGHLEILSKYSVLVGIAAFLWNVTPYSASNQELAKQSVYRAWETIRSASGSGASGGVRFALQDLLEQEQSLDGLPLEKVRINDFDFTTVRGRSLQGVQFKQSYLVHCNFAGLDLQRGVLQSDLTGSSFAGSDLRNTNFFGAILTRCKLDGANLSSLSEISPGLAVKGSSVDLSNADLGESSLTNATFSDAKLIEVKLHKVTGTKADFSGANLSRSVFSGAKLIATKFTNAILDDVDFTADFGRKAGPAKLQNCDFRGARFRNAKLNSDAPPAIRAILGISSSEAGNQSFPVDLTGSNLTGADFRGANLRGAILTDVIIEKNFAGKKTNFSGADLRGVVGLTQEHLNNSIIDKTTLLPSKEITGS